MTLQAAIDAELPFLRAEATARMTSRVSVRRKTGATTKVGGYDVDEWVNAYTDLPFRLKGDSTRKVSIGGVEFQEATAEGHMPWDATDLRDKDLLEVTAGEWAGSVFRIVEAVKGDQRTARRVPIVETTRPEEWS